MTHFLIYTEDKADSLNTRLESREAHLRWVQSSPDVKLLSGGPWLDDTGDMRGSLMIVEAADLTTVKAWLKKDPYTQAGLTGFKRIRQFNWLLGAPN